MIVLFGSYAKNSYVDYDQRVEFGTPTYYMSDYDIVILTRKPIGAAEYSLYEKIKDKFFENKNRPFHTHPQFINYGIEDFNYALSKAHYFETEIKRDGVVLFDSGTYKLARRRKLDYTEIRDRAQKYFDDKLPLRWIYTKMYFSIIKEPNINYLLSIFTSPPKICCV